MPPHEARGPARSRNTIDVAVKDVVAVRDYGEVFMARLDVGRASRAGSTLESQLVVADCIVARLVYRAAVSPSLVIAALVYQHDPAFAWADGQCVVIHLHLLRRCNENVVAPEPALVGDAVMADDVVANDCIERDLVKDTGAVVALDDVILVKHVAAVDVTPQPGTDVIVDMIAAKDDIITQDDLHAAGFPLEVETMDVVRPDPVILDENIPAPAPNTHLAVVMNVAASHAAACSDHDSSPAVQAHFAVLDDPARSSLTVDCPLLGDARVLLDDHVSDQHVRSCAFEPEGSHRGLDFVPRRIIGEIEASARAVEIEPARLNAFLA